MPVVSVIIPSLNSPLIDDVVQAILAQDGIEHVAELLVVGRDDAGLLRRAPKVQLIDTGTPVDASTARNLGIAAAAGDLLIFLDSDCLPQPGWLQGHLAAHAAGHQVVGGGVLPDGDDYWHLTYNLTMFHEVFTTAGPGIRPLLPTLNLSVAREVIDLVGGLDPALPYSHDLDWTTRMREAGYQPYFCPAAAVRHRHSRHTLQAVWRDCAVNGQYARRARLKHRDTLHTPAVLQSRQLTRWLSPFIAAAVTARILLRRPATILRNAHTLPAIYLTKIAWCWGAGRSG